MSSGKFYRYFIDPILRDVHASAVAEIPAGSRVIDIACGNGTLALKLSGRADQVVGIDVSGELIKYARRRAVSKGVDGIEFIEMDANDLSRFSDKEFDFATISMAVHQFKVEDAISILGEMSRISGNLIIVDYKIPLSRKPGGQVVRLIERLAGKEHHTNFLDYSRQGGLDHLLMVSGLSRLETILETAVFSVVKAG